MVFKIRDITERKRTAKTLRECKRQYDNLVSKISVGIYILHSVPEGAFALDYVSPRMAEMLNESVESLLADCQLFFHSIHPDDLSSFVKLNQEGIQQRQPFDWEGRYLVEGTVKWLHFKSSPESLGNGDVLWHGVVTDNTERRRTEKALRESEERYRAQFNRAGDGIFILSPDGTLVEVNESMARMHGYTVQELQQINLQYLGTPETSRLAPERIRRLLAGESLTFEVEHYHKDGHVFPLEVSASLIISGGNSYIQSFHRDITERKKHENEQLRVEKLESLGVLAGGIAHDFNNILTVIKGNLSFAQIFLDATHKSYKPLVEAEKASVRATEISHQLMNFARGGEPVKKLVSLQHLVSESVSFGLHGSNVLGSVDIPDSIHAIEADEGQMSQMFHNIIINATQGMPEGGTLTVTAQNEKLFNTNAMALPGGSYVRLSITDQGCGISDDDMNRIFDPYFTTKSAGNGLGLASVHSIVSRHGGHIGASSVVGKGTTFIIHLPSI